MRSLILVCAISASLGYGQIDSNAVTVTASRNASLQPDTVLFGVTVTSGFNTGLDDVIAALAGSGITAANFSSLSSPQVIPGFSPGTGIITLPPSPQPMLQWNFTLPVPLSKLKDTSTTLTNVQQSIAKKNAGLAMSFSIQGTQVSQQLQQSQPCIVSDLLADARTQAQKLADAAGLTLGQILALSSSTSMTTGTSNSIFNPLPSFSICAATVKYSLIRLSQ
jgi:hypothetical protein